MRILVSNDDGISKLGIHQLALALKQLGEVTVVAPKTVQSGKGFALNFGDKVYIEKVFFEEGIEAYQVDGSPNDCVSLALNGLVDYQFDLIVAGINYGSNICNDTLCSGTVGAASQGLLHNIPCIAVSLDFGQFDDFSIPANQAVKVASWFLQQSFNKDFCLNVNIPNIKEEEIKGYRIVSSGAKKNYHKKAKFTKQGNIIIADLSNLHSVTHDDINDLDHDKYALSQGYVTLQPLCMDLTDYSSIDILKNNFSL